MPEALTVSGPFALAVEVITLRTECHRIETSCAPHLSWPRTRPSTPSREHKAFGLSGRHSMSSIAPVNAAAIACALPESDPGNRSSEHRLDMALNPLLIQISGDTENAVDISFDPVKRDVTIINRGLDFADAGTVFAGRTKTLQDNRSDYGEDRFITAGYLAGRAVVLVWTPREFPRRIISMRHMHADEESTWFD